MFTTNKVIPIEYVKLEGGRIALEKNTGELKDLPSYDPDTYINLDAIGYPEEDQDVHAVYWYPPLRYSWWMTGGGISPSGYVKPVYVTEVYLSVGSDIFDRLPDYASVT